MPHQQIPFPALSCPKCLHTHGLHEDEDGVSDIEWHMGRCDETRQAEGFVEASELAGLKTYDYPDDWRDWITRAEDWQFDFDPAETETAEADR